MLTVFCILHQLLICHRPADQMDVARGAFNFLWLIYKALVETSKNE